MSAKRLLPVIFLCSVWLGCGGGGNPAPPPVGRQDPQPDPQQPSTQSQDPEPDRQAPEIGIEEPLPNARERLPAGGEAGASANGR
jgi:hypothetical protein